LIVGRLFDLGYFRALFMTSGFLLVVATFLAAQCTEYWQFLLSQGIMAGVSFVPCYSTSFVVYELIFCVTRLAVVDFLHAITPSLRTGSRRSEEVRSDIWP